MSRRATKAAQAEAEPPAPPRLAYRVDEVAQMLGVCRRTVERAINDGRLIASKRLGATLIEAESVKALFGTAPAE